jgi:hypothetical protein
MPDPYDDHNGGHRRDHRRWWRQLKQPLNVKHMTGTDGDRVRDCASRVTGQTRTRPAARGGDGPVRSHGAHPPSLTWKALAARWQHGLAGLAAFLLLAQLLGISGVLTRSVLPLASTVLARAAGLVSNPQFLTDLAATLEA